jgi:lipid A 3-O-deacylase
MFRIYTRLSRVSALSSMCAAGIGALLWLASPPLHAEPDYRSGPSLGVDEVRLGVLAANLDVGESENADMLINGEILFSRFSGPHGYPLHDFFLSPRPHIGFSVTPDDGTNQVYAGLTWEFRLSNLLFVETSFGGTLHDGPSSASDPDSYGCSLLFRESASIGYEFTERLRLLLTVDHMSNAGLCDQNQGLTNAGVRLGYRW